MYLTNQVETTRIGFPAWAKPWSVSWGDLMVGTRVLGEGRFGKVLLGGVRNGGEISNAAIYQLQGILYWKIYLLYYECTFLLVLVYY